MKKIDDELGGTIFKRYLKLSNKKQKDKSDDDEFDEWEEDNDSNEDKAKYWFTRDKMDKIIKVHDYLGLFTRNWKSFVIWFNIKSCGRLK